MGVAGLLIVLGVIIWLLFSPLIGIILLVLGVVDLLWAGRSYGWYGGPYSGRRRTYW